VRRPASSVLFALALFALGGCRDASAPAAALDDAGREVVLPERPATVFPLAPNVTELVAAAAGVSRLAGVSPADDFPAGIAALPRVATFPIDTEGLVALGPALVLGSLDVTPVADADRLTGLGLPTYLFGFETMADIPRALRTLDTLLQSRGGATAATAFEARVAAVRQAVEGYARPRVLLLIGDEGTFYAFGRASYASEMVRAAGGDNLTDRYDGATATPDEEAILEMAPEVILILGGADETARTFSARHPALFSVPAVVNGRVYGLDPDLVSRPGPRVAEGLEAMARRLHPEAFAAGAA
jgi:iron complex transport system substrate-binding protein